MKTMNLNRESGFTLLELLLVIGVAALLLIGGIATYRLVSEGNRATEAVRLMLLLKQESAVVAQQSAGEGYTGINNAMLVNMGVLRTANQRTPWNTALTVNGAVDSLTIQFDAVPKASCIKLVMAVTDPAEVDSVNGAAPPQNVGQASALCPGDTNNVTWVFP